MSELSPELRRFSQLLDLVRKEDARLLAVRDRLIPKGTTVNLAWLEATIADDVGADRLEAFSSRFSRMQDTVIDKLIPQLLVAAGEIPMAAIDNLNRVERLNFISSTDTWIEMRRLRNRLVHEYIDDLSEMLPALKKAYAFTDELHSAYKAIADYAHNRLGIDL
ncbi:hypothetical protein [Alkalilimnicola ehrlichii]|uniref:hypothetical protein n=1 Tax=Alkalilimnicola ehrlichii TaxID=351052 RepID=UPI003BA21007